MNAGSEVQRAFIDLAELGRTGWPTGALTVVLLKLLKFLIALIAALVILTNLLFHVPDACKTVVFLAVDATATIFGLWLACRFILRRPFGSLVSGDLTFRLRRCLLGAALYLPANLLGLSALALFCSARAGEFVFPFGHFEWPHGGTQVAASIGMLLAIPFLAFAEEILFRAWLTQALKHYLRYPLLVVAVVALLFAIYHTQYDWREKTLMMFCSLGLSALSLRDQRLELAVGSHSMMNICATLQIAFMTGHQIYPQVSATTVDVWIMVFLKGALPYALMYLVLNLTKGWFAPPGFEHQIVADGQSQQQGI